MGIIAGIAIPTTIAVINRQKRNAAKSSADNVMAAAETVLMEAAAKSQSQWPDGVETTTATNGVCQIKITTLAAKGEIKENPLQESATSTAEDTTTYIYIDNLNKCHWSSDTVYINSIAVSVDGTATTTS